MIGELNHSETLETFDKISSKAALTIISEPSSVMWESLQQRLKWAMGHSGSKNRTHPGETQNYGSSPALVDER